KLLLGLAVSALTLPCFANGEIETHFNPGKSILPSSRWTGENIWSADVWIINTGERYNETQYNHVWAPLQMTAMENIDTIMSMSRERCYKKKAFFREHLFLF
ncbi:MAG: hypothetical protein K2K97_04000, partial [Muribaculaceae bacterium]|nr:hypothetical protein [Muribaculaceae bacterium]